MGSIRKHKNQLKNANQKANEVNNKRMYALIFLGAMVAISYVLGYFLPKIGHSQYWENVPTFFGVAYYIKVYLEGRKVTRQFGHVTEFQKFAYNFLNRRAAERKEKKRAGRARARD